MKEQLEQIEILKKNIAGNLQINPLTAIEDCRKLSDLADDLHDVYAKAYADCYLGTAYYFLGRNEEMLHLFEKSIPMFHANGFFLLEVRAYNILGVSFSSRHDYITSLDYFMSALNLSKKYQFYKQCATICSNISNIYTRIGDYKSAIAELKIALSYTTKIHDPSFDDSKKLFIMNMCFNLICMEKYEYAMDVLSNTHVEDESQLSQRLRAFYFYCRMRITYYLGEKKEFENYKSLVLSCLIAKMTIIDQVLIYIEAARFFLAIEDFDSLKALMNNMEEKSKNFGLNKSLSRLSEIAITYYKRVGNKEKLREAYREYAFSCIEKTRESKHSMALAASMYITLEGLEHEQRLLDEQKHKLLNRSEYDALTRLPNRNRLQAHIDDLIEQAVNYSRNLCVILMDVDCFKQYNDTFGHPKGDRVLRSIGEELRKMTTDELTFFRYGGDEFIGVVVGKTDRQIDEIIDNLSANILGLKIESVNKKRNEYISVTAGYVNRIPDGSDGMNSFINEADAALYRNKAAWKLA